MKYRYEIDWDWVHTPDDVNDLIHDEEHPSLTSADQIMSGVKESTGIDVTSLISGFVGGKAAANTDK